MSHIFSNSEFNGDISKWNFSNLKHSISEIGIPISEIGIKIKQNQKIETKKIKLKKDIMQEIKQKDDTNNVKHNKICVVCPTCRSKIDMEIKLI